MMVTSLIALQLPHPLNASLDSHIDPVRQHRVEFGRCRPIAHLADGGVIREAAIVRLGSR